MPGKTKIIPPPPANSCQPGVARSLLYNGSKFQGHQKSKGNCYDVEVVLQVRIPIHSNKDIFFGLLIQSHKILLHNLNLLVYL